MCNRFSRSVPPTSGSPGAYWCASTPGSLTISLATGSTIPATRTCREPWFQYRGQAAAPVFVGDRAPARPPFVGEATHQWMLTYVARLRPGVARVSRVGHTVFGWTAALCILCSLVLSPIIGEPKDGGWRNQRQTGTTTMVSARRAAMPHDASEEFRRGLRERVRLARELAALRAGFATVAEHYERVLRSLQALGIELGINPHYIGHATDPEWGPATLLVYGDERFLKHEQTVIDQLLHKLP